MPEDRETVYRETVRPERRETVFTVSGPTASRYPALRYPVPQYPVSGGGRKKALPQGHKLHNILQYNILRKNKTGRIWQNRSDSGRTWQNLAGPGRIGQNGSESGRIVQVAFGKSCGAVPRQPARMGSVAFPLGAPGATVTRASWTHVPYKDRVGVFGRAGHVGDPALAQARRPGQSEASPRQCMPEARRGAQTGPYGMPPPTVYASPAGSENFSVVKV